MNEATKQVIEHGIDGIEAQSADSFEGAELHHHLYNEDYFIIGYYDAEQFLQRYGIFNAIEKIKQYEQDQFGEVSTNFSDSERVANMFAYIKGEEALGECEHLQTVWDKLLTQEDLDTIKGELEEQLG